MDKFELQDFNKRIGLNTKLDNISSEICKNYDLGNFISNELITIGYEDYNYYLTTSIGKYCVKIFSKERTKEDVSNYLDRIRVVANSDVSAPKPLLVNNNIVLSLDYNDNHYDICVFEYINGKNYFQLQQDPESDVIKELAKQTAMINNLDIKPNFIYDSWAIINFIEEYNKKREYLSDEYKNEFDKLAEELKNIDFEQLPKAFVHGDIISTNVMLDENKKIWIIDFAVSNYLPRIIDLAVISCNMCLVKNSKEKTYENISLLLSEYNKYNKLTEYELEVFGTLYRLANAMHILQTEYIIKTDGDSEENQYWLNEGIIGYSFGEEKSLSKGLKENNNWRKMNRDFAEKWLNKLKEYWFNKEIKKAVSLFTKTTFYQETPFMEPYTTIEEINEEWQHIKNENIKNIEIKLLTIDGNTIIAEWFLEQNNQEYDGVYEIKFNDNLECVYFKSWEMINNE